jgi:hypothetical protein
VTTSTSGITDVLVSWWKKSSRRASCAMLRCELYSGFVESVVSGSGRRQWFFFWVDGIGDGKRRRHGPWSSSYVSFLSRLQANQNGGGTHVFIRVGEDQGGCSS